MLLQKKKNFYICSCGHQKSINFNLFHIHTSYVSKKNECIISSFCTQNCVKWQLKKVFRVSLLPFHICVITNKLLQQIINILPRNCLCMHLKLVFVSYLIAYFSDKKSIKQTMISRRASIIRRSFYHVSIEIWKNKINWFKCLFFLKELFI